MPMHMADEPANISTTHIQHTRTHISSQFWTFLQITGGGRCQEGEE